MIVCACFCVRVCNNYVCKGVRLCIRVYARVCVRFCTTLCVTVSGGVCTMRMCVCPRE